MDEFKVFETFKERGEWVEALFMAASLRHGYKVLKPWGDSAPFDLALYFGNRIVRVQVKSTPCRVGTGYFCQFKPNYFSDPYTLAQLDFFCARGYEAVAGSTGRLASLGTHRGRALGVDWA